MNKKRLLMSLPLFALTLTSCAQQIDWHDQFKVYAAAMQWHEEFNILQLTDIHWNVNSSTASSKQYLDKVLKQADEHIKATYPGRKIDLVELTGDQFMLANAYHVKTFVEYFETKAVEYGFKYAIIWGNHDRHGMYSPNWLADKYREAAHCIYIEPDDNLYGRSNYVINLTNDGTNETQAVWQIVNLDSGASFSESPLAIGRNYDYIRPEQTQWYLNQHDDAPNVGGGVPSIAYYHIPQQDNLEAWDAIHKGGATLKNKFFKLEGFGDADKPEYASDFIEVARNHGLKAAFMGHAHNVDWTVQYKDVVIGLGVKTGAELYFAHIDPADTKEEVKEGLQSVNESLPPEQQIKEKFDLIGASLVTIKDASNFELEHLYLNEREGTDFVRWAKW